METIDKVLTIKQAAESLQVSPDTVRRRIKTGELKAEKMPGAYGLQWVIRADDLAESMQVVNVVPFKHSLTADDLEAMLRKVMQENNDEIRQLRAEVQQLRTELQQQRQIEGPADKGKRWWKLW